MQTPGMNPKTQDASRVPEKASSTNKFWFFFIVLYLIIDYGRPQYLFNPIEIVRPGLLITLILTICLIVSGALHLTKSRQTIRIWLFIGLLAVYVPFAHNNHYAFLAFRTMILFMPFILSTMICIDSLARLKKIINIMIILMIYIALYSITHGGHGPGHYFIDENDLSLYINTWLPFCYFLFQNEKKTKIRFLYLAGMVTGLVAIVYSFSRGGFVGLVCMATIVWLLSSRKLLSILVICLIAGIVYWAGGDDYLKEISTISNKDDRTANERILSWKGAWDMFLDNPLGVGGENFQVRFPEYQPKELQRGMYGRAAHSLWFTVLSELGIIGVYLYLSLLYYNLKDIYFLRRLRLKRDTNETRYLKALALAYLASFAGYFASATFLSVLYYAHYWYLIAVLVPAVRLGKAAISTSPADDGRLAQAGAI